MNKTNLRDYLHLVMYVFALIMLSVLVVALTSRLSSKYLPSQKKSSNVLPATVGCNHSQTTHIVIIQDNTTSPEHIEALLCDKLTITNNDDKLRYIAFGVHNEHITYDGITEKNLKKGESFTVTLNQSGSYIFHDHNQEEVEATFTVTK